MEGTVTEAEATADIRRKTAATQEPVLTEDEVLALVRLSRAPDLYGRVAGDADWTPTYETDGAAAEGWRWKAGKVVAGFDISGDNSKLTRSQVHAHCLAMAQMYAERAEYNTNSTTFTFLDPAWVVNL